MLVSGRIRPSDFLLPKKTSDFHPGHRYLALLLPAQNLGPFGGTSNNSWLGPWSGVDGGYTTGGIYRFGGKDGLEMGDVPWEMVCQGVGGWKQINIGESVKDWNLFLVVERSWMDLKVLNQKRWRDIYIYVLFFHHFLWFTRVCNECPLSFGGFKPSSLLA